MVLRAPRPGRLFPEPNLWFRLPRGTIGVVLIFKDSAPSPNRPVRVSAEIRTCPLQQGPPALRTFASLRASIPSACMFPASTTPLGAAVPAPPTGPLRLALVEDDATVRQLLHQYLSRCPEFECVAVVGSMEALWQELALCLPPQLLLLDLSLPGQSGLEALPPLLERLPELCVLVQTSNDAADTIYQALRRGARGFVVKSATPLPAYRQALLDVAAGGAVMSPSVARKMLEYFTPVPSREEHLLSERERQVLEGLVAGQTEKQVAAALHLSPTTVRTYVVRLYEKLRVANKAELLARAAQGKL